MEGLVRPVLIMDQDQQVFEELGQRLVRFGFSPVRMQSSAFFTEKIKEIKPAVIIMDVMLGDRDGVKLIREVKDDYATKDIPVFVASNYAGRLNRRTGPRVEGVYTKPVNYDHLVAHVLGAHKRRVGDIDMNSGKPIA